MKKYYLLLAAGALGCALASLPVLASDAPTDEGNYIWQDENGDFWWRNGSEDEYLGDGNYITYGATEVAEEVRAVQDAGYEEWMLWSAANKYHLEGLSVDGSSAAAAEVSTETSEEGETAAEDADGTSEAESAAETAQQ